MRIGPHQKVSVPSPTIFCVLLYLTLSLSHSEIAHAKGLSPKKLEQSESSKRKAEEEAEQAAQAKKKKQKKAKKTARKVDLDKAEDQEKEKPPPPPLSDFIKEKLKRNKEVSCPISILFSFPFSP